MKLMTKAIMNALPKLYATENIKLEDKIIICKFFTPWSNWTWFVFEGEKQEDDNYLFFVWYMALKKSLGIFYYLSCNLSQGLLV